MLKRALLYVVVMFILLALAVSAGQWDKSTALLQQYAAEISAWIPAQEQANAAENSASTTLTHRADSLLSWSNNNIIPSKRDLKTLSEKNGRTLLRLPQGWYLAQVEQRSTETRSTLVPIRYDLSHNALAARAPFPANPGISAAVQISTTQTAFPVIVGGKEICWLTASGSVHAAWLAWLKLGAWVLFLAIFLKVLAEASNAVRERFGQIPGAILLVLISLGLLWMNTATGFTAAQFSALPLFAPMFDQAPLLGRSVGDWLLHTSILLFLVLGGARLKRENEPVSAGKWRGTLAYVLAGFCLLIGAECLRELALFNRSGFDFENVLGLGASGFFALVGAIAAMAGLFLLSHRWAMSARSLPLTRNERFTAVGLAVAVLAALGFAFAPAETNMLWLTVFALVFLLALDSFVHWNGAGFGWAILWLVLFSLFVSVQLHQLGAQRDKSQRLEYAKALAADRDTVLAEHLLPKVLANIEKDSAAIGVLLKPWPFKAGATELRDYLNRAIFTENYLFQHYRPSVFAFDKSNQPILQGQKLGYEQVVLGNWATAKALSHAPHIRYCLDTDGTFRYMLQANVQRMGDPTQPATLYLFFDRTQPAPTRTFSQLFFNSPFKNLAQLARYDFSIAKNGRLTVDQGLANQSALGAKLANGGAAEFESPGRSDALAKSADGQTVAAVGHRSGGWLKQVYLFSIIFTLAALCLLTLAFFNSWLGFLPAGYDLRLSTRGSLARRIHFWNVTLLALSFVVVGYLTYRHFTDAAQNAQRDDFKFRATALLSNLKTQALNTGLSSDSLQQVLPRSLASISTSLGMDAQFFDPAGNSQFSTQEELAHLGVLPVKMNPVALEFLKKNPQSDWVARERSAGIAYATQYRSLQNGTGQVLGFLAVPYHEASANAGAEVSDFIGMLASLYVFLLLIAYGVTFLLARSITKPVRLLSEKVQELRLEDKNEPLAYAGDAEDEISQLIGEYNNMVGKLESSKAQLVKLEREGAWREMARQVAHDIKNPLTTMKLSMQQLERLSGSPEQAAAYLRKAITRLIEQIDSLAQIASEFSMFANLDIKHKNDVVINEVVESVHDLFSEQRQVDLSLTLPDQRFHIIGDKNHLIRVFNNLVINAIQAIPSDRRGQIRVALRREGDFAIIQIGDNGGGIPPEIRDRVFEPNFTTKTSGSGLGLAICKKIIEAHDGTIRFETRDNEGTDFFVEVPVVAVG